MWSQRWENRVPGKPMMENLTLEWEGAELMNEDN